MNRQEIAQIIVKKLLQHKNELQFNYYNSGPINHFFLDDVLPNDLASKIRLSFPDSSRLQIKKSLRELKFIGAQMNEYSSLLEEALFSFQNSDLIQVISEITGISGLEKDESLYAGGVSIMRQGHFLNPHLDNSHDMKVMRYRALNILYYVSPGWGINSGGNLELWPNGPTQKGLTVESRFNRLVVMVTNKQSWHSVSKVEVDESRCCISNYYFTQQPIDGVDYFHVTSFRGRPDQRIRDLILRVDIKLRTLVRKLFKKGIFNTGHYYKKND